MKNRSQNRGIPAEEHGRKVGMAVFVVPLALTLLGLATALILGFAHQGLPLD